MLFLGVGPQLPPDPLPRVPRPARSVEVAASEHTAAGYWLRVRRPCGVRFERYVTADDAGQTWSSGPWRSSTRVRAAGGPGQPVVASAVRAGIVSRNVVPWPSTLSTVSVAPGCSATRERTMDSPSPVPSAFVV